MNCSKKAPKLSNVYQYAMGYADIEVYYQTGAYEDIANTAVSLLEANSKDFYITHKLYLLERATISWVLSTAKPVILPKYFYHNLPASHVKAGCVIHIENIVKSNSKQLPLDLLKSTIDTLIDISLTLNSPELKSEQFKVIYDLIILLFTYGPVEIVYDLKNLSIENKLEISFEYLPTPTAIKSILRANSTAFLKDFQCSYNKRELEEDEMLIIHDSNQGAAESNFILNKM